MPRGRPPQCRLTIDTNEQHRLLSLVRQRTAPAGLVARARAIYLLSHGESVSAVADRLGKSRCYIYKWLRRYEEHGLDGLRAGCGDGARSHHGVRQEATL
jgi:transposase